MGSIIRETHLVVAIGKKKQKHCFYVMNLGSEEAILGYPFLKAANPEPLSSKEKEEQKEFLQYTAILIIYLIQ